VVNVRAHYVIPGANIELWNAFCVVSKVAAYRMIGVLSHNFALLGLQKAIMYHEVYLTRKFLPCISA
jgi:hypothetical protein